MTVLVAFATRHGATAGYFRGWPAIDAWADAIDAELTSDEAPVDEPPQRLGTAPGQHIGFDRGHVGPQASARVVITPAALVLGT